MLRMKAAMAPIFSLLCVLLLACQVKAAVEERWLSVPAEHIVALASCGDQAVKAGDTHTVSLSVPEADEYHVVLSYSPVQAGLFSSIVLVEIDGVELRSALPFLWRDIPGETRYDRYCTKSFLTKSFAMQSPAHISSHTQSMPAGHMS